MERYKSYSAYLIALYGTATYRVGVDAGFSCPNRSADRRSGGCTFCDEFGSRAAYQRDQKGCDPSLDLPERVHRVVEQIDAGRAFLERRYDTRSFILYFQAFSSTFAPVHELKTLYDAGLRAYPFRELVVSTRPDCVSEEIADLLGTYRKDGLDVWVELGLQSALDRTLRLIHRGHTAAQFDGALELLRDHGIKIAAHVIFGLPGEGWDDMMYTIEHLASLRIDGIKIHNLHVPKGSRLFREFLGGELSLPSAPRHIEYLIGAIERLPAQTVIMRLTCDTPVRARGLPIRPLHKGAIADKLRSELGRRDTRQGRLFR